MKDLNVWRKQLSCEKNFEQDSEEEWSLKIEETIKIHNFFFSCMNFFMCFFFFFPKGRANYFLSNLETKLCHCHGAKGNYVKWHS